MFCRTTSAASCEFDRRSDIETNENGVPLCAILKFPKRRVCRDTAEMSQAELEESWPEDWPFPPALSWAEEGADE